MSRVKDIEKLRAFQRDWDGKSSVIVKDTEKIERRLTEISDTLAIIADALTKEKESCGGTEQERWLRGE